MRIVDVLSSVQRLCIDTTPLIYYVETNPTYIKKMDEIVDLIENHPIDAVTSVVALTEVLIHPMRQNNRVLETRYRQLLTQNKDFSLLPVTISIADMAADLRARYNLRTPDALHVATAIESKSDAFLTNDKGLKRVSEITILVLDELTV